MADIGIGGDLGGIGESAVGSDTAGSAQDRWAAARKKQKPKNGVEAKDGKTNATNETTQQPTPKPVSGTETKDLRKPSKKLMAGLRKGRRARLLSNVTEEDIRSVLLGGRPPRRGTTKLLS